MHNFMCTPFTAVRPPSVSSPDELVFHLQGCHAVIISITDDLKDIGIIWEDAEHAAELSGDLCCPMRWRHADEVSY